MPNVGRLDRERLQAQLNEQQVWMAERGKTEAGYVEHYGSLEAENHYGDGGERIHEADNNRLLELEALLALASGYELGFYDEYVASYEDTEERLYVTDPRQEDVPDPRYARGYKSPELARAASVRQGHERVLVHPRRTFVQKHDRHEDPEAEL